MAAGKVRHWKHGWIPISPEAKAYVAGRGPKPGGPGPNRITTPGGHRGTKVASEFGPRGTPMAHTAIIHRVKPDPGRKVMYSPEAEKAAAAVLARYTALEPKVTPTLVALAAQHGGYLQGLDHRLKGQESLARKIQDKSKAKHLALNVYAGRIGDALRYTQISNDENYGASAQGTIDALRAQGNTVTVENTWTPGSQYKGINTNVTDRAGNTYELQFHTAESFRVKTRQHDLYEISRDPKRSPAERQAANDAMAANMAALADPVGAASVH